MAIDFVILSAGLGSRMKSSTPKFFQKIADKPIIRYVIDSCKSISDRRIIAVTNDALKDHEFFNDIKTVVQESPLGTADAVNSAVSILDSKYTIIMCGDMPLIETRHIESLLSDESDVSFIAMKIPDDLSNMPYGRVITDDLGNFQKIVEFRDATDSEKNCKFANSGIYKIKTDLLKNFITNVQKNEKSGEFYLTDIISILKDNGFKISVINSEEYWPFHGINNMQDLANAEEIVQNNLRDKFMKNGVKLLDPKSVYFSADTFIDNDVVIEQNVVFKRSVKVHQGSTIKAFCYLEDCEIMENSSVGPFARIRGNSKLSQNSDIGNFVEIKGSTIGIGSKVKHLSYIGDATIGIKSNIGAGTITCNYDGVKKHKTHLGDNVFIGSNCSLIAPVSIGNGSIVAAGSVITKNVPENSLAISRIIQETKLDKASDIWNKKGKK